MSGLSHASLGIALMLAGTLMLTLQDAVSKWLIDSFHVGEILFYRGIFAYLPILAFVYFDHLKSHADGRSLRQRLHSNQPWANVLRAMLNTGAGFAVISAYAFMPLAEAMTITFSSPILVSVLAIPLLGETVSFRRWAAIAIGFLGVLLIAKPGRVDLGWVVWLPVLAAVLLAFRDILTRRLGAVDSTSVILFFTVTVSTVSGLLVMLVLGSSWPSSAAWALFFALGLINGVAHYLIIKSFSLAQASTIAPLRYSSVLWALLIGFWIWGDIPGWISLLGALLIVASGLYILFEERSTR